MDRRLPIKQIQDIPVSAYNGNVLFFNQDVVTVCNSTTKTLLGAFNFNTANLQPGLNRVATICGFGSWDTSSALQSDKLFISAKLTGESTVVLFEEIIDRTQASFTSGHFKFEVLFNRMRENAFTLGLTYDDTAPGNIIKSFEYTGVDLISNQILIEVYGQMGASINPVSLNQGIISGINRVKNPGFEQGLEEWVREPEQRTNIEYQPHSGEKSCRIYSGIITQRIDQENQQTDTINPGYIFQPGVFQTTGTRYYLEFWHKNTDAYRYASYVEVPGYIDRPNQISDETQSFSIVSVYAFNSSTLQKGALITTVKTGKTYQKATIVHTAIQGFDALYFEMSPASFRSSVTRNSRNNLLGQTGKLLGINLPPTAENAFLLAVDYALIANLHIDDVRVSEMGLPFNSSNKEIRLRQFTTQYIS